MPHPISGRSCGECSACCFTHGVEEVETTGGSWCKHCDLGHGCRIYASRPEGCQLYECWWLKGKGEESDRPDKSGFVLDGVDIPGQKHTLIGLWEAKRGGLKTDRALQIAEAILDQDCVICFHENWPTPTSRLRFPWQMGDNERKDFIKAFNTHFKTTVTQPG